MASSSLLQELSDSSELVIECFSSVPADKVYYSPSPDRWSAAQIMQHLALVDRGILVGLKKALEKGSYRVPFMKKYLPIHVIARSRLKKMIAPEAVRPGDVAAVPREQLIENYRDARSALITFASDNSGCWSKITWKHRTFGVLSLPQTLRFIMAHEKRHMVQLKEVSSL